MLAEDVASARIVTVGVETIEQLRQGMQLASLLVGVLGGLCLGFRV
jgi:hypothetical protein